MKTLTIDELRTLWEPAAQGNIVKWKQINPGWPDTPIKLLGPGPESGTFDYFTQAVVGKARRTGTAFAGTIPVGLSVEELMKREVKP